MPNGQRRGILVAKGIDPPNGSVAHSDSPGAEVMAFAHITMPSRDVRAMVRFLEATLGWTSIERPNNIPFPAAWMAIGAGQELHLLQLDDYAPSPFEREYGRHLA